MLKCKELVDKADALVDGTPLSWRERFALRMHLLMCHHCRRYLHQLRAMVTSLRSHKPAATSDEQMESVLAKLDDKH